MPPPTTDWTCPFCALLCESLVVDAGPGGGLRGSGCPRANAALAALAPPASAAAAWVDGAAVAISEALDEAARRLTRWQQPLFGGLGTDVAGARALYRLAAHCGAILDAADGASLAHGLRALQDKGQYMATLAEVRVRAALVVCVGTPAVDRFPEFFNRIGMGQPGSPCRDLVFLGAEAPAPSRYGAPVAGPALAIDTIAGSGDLAADLQQLATAIDRPQQPGIDAAWVALAQRLHASPYSVLVWEAGRLPWHGALIVEAINRIVGTLNQRTRAGSLSLGGCDGAATVNQTVTWLSGLPLRTRVAAGAMQHEPVVFDAQRLLADRAVDGLLWVHSFDPRRVPPAAPGVPRIVLGPPAMVASLEAADTVFLPVATPGLCAEGHLFRTDGPVALHLPAARDDGLSTVGQLLTALSRRLAPVAEGAA